MNAGLSNLATLKQHLLAPALRSAVTYDVQITALGLGMAAAIEKFCNRKFARVENDTHICTADRDHAYVPRYPLETFTSIEMKADINVGWEMQTGLVLNTNPASGLVYWGAGISFAWAQMRITYTGGYFFETLEPDDEAYPSSLPAGAAALPEDLKLAWLLQCRNVWASVDKLGTAITKIGTGAESVTGTLPTLELIPQVKTMLAGHIRYAIT